MLNAFQSLAKDVVAQLSTTDSIERLDEEARQRLAKNVEDLLQQLRTPLEAMHGVLAGPQVMTSAKVASSMGVFDAFAASGNKTLTLNELHSQSKGDKELLQRILRQLSVYGFVKQMSQDEWQSTSFGATFAKDGIHSALLQHFYEQMRSQAMLDDYLRTHDYRSPTDAFNGPWQYAYNTDKHYFGWLDTNDVAQNAFNKVMTIHQQMRGQNWFDYYPVTERLTTNSTDDVVLVDIGGGVGHDTIALTQRFPNLQGQLVVQDLPRVIESITTPLPSNIQAQPHDMFATQPIHGAKAYYLRTVLHDWPDKQALAILRRIREACGPDSLLLINELAVDPEHVSALSVFSDLVMMTTCSALERTEQQWASLLTQAGFKLIQVWKPTVSAAAAPPVALFEAVPA